MISRRLERSLSVTRICPVERSIATKYRSTPTQTVCPSADTTTSGSIGWLFQPSP
ncbi:hypothetical protein [Chroococcidiopsis sp.]|uniref:hypothetical protein n=1 Tax=Chroococcidiopsis sp. TaxID=3088168 RepID=UPI003F2F1A72